MVVICKQLTAKAVSFPALTFPRREVSKTRARSEAGLQAAQVPLARGCVVSIFRSPVRLQPLAPRRECLETGIRLDVLRREALAPATATSDVSTLPNKSGTVEYVSSFHHLGAAIPPSPERDGILAGYL
jgi:hypothetical protein